MMKQTDRVIKTGDYYELESIEDLITQKISKKQDITSTLLLPSQPSQNIVTILPSQKEAIDNLFYIPNLTHKVDNYSLEQCQNSLEALLKQPITDQQRKEIEKLLNQISSIKSNGEIPLNVLPKAKWSSSQEKSKGQTPKQITLQSKFDISSLEKDVQGLQSMKFMEISRLQNLVGIMLGQIKSESSQNAQQQQQPIDKKIKQQIDSLYNSLHSLKCVNDLSGIMMKIASNQSKFIEMNNWVQNLEQTLQKNKEILDQFENDQIVLKNLEENFNGNIKKVREIIKNLSQ